MDNADPELEFDIVAVGAIYFEGRLNNVIRRRIFNVTQNFERSQIVPCADFPALNPVSPASPTILWYFNSVVLVPFVFITNETEVRYRSNV